jgi:hypothetical protein
MSEFAGPILTFDELYQITAASENLSFPQPFDTWLINPVLDGAYTDTQPVSDEPENSFNGIYTHGVNRFFLYDRIQIDPSSVELGNLVSAQTRLVYVWNGFFESKTVSSFSGVNTEGITVEEPYETPYALVPFQQVVYEFQVSLEGPAALDATYTIVVDGVDYVIEVTGSRAVLWPFGPNWGSPVLESLEWFTNVIVAYSGSEQRICLRSIPRRRLEFDFCAKLEESQRLDNILWGWQNRSFAVPIWQYKCKLTGPAAAGAVSIPLVTTSSGFVVGQTAVLMRSADYYEVIEIDAVASNSITPKRALELDWSAGDVIYPVAISNFESNVALDRRTSNVTVGRAIFLADPGQTDPFVPATAATDVYNSKEIVLQQPHWRGGIDSSSEFPFERVDSNTGPLNNSATRDTAMLNKRFIWHLSSRAEVASFRAFLGRCKGRNRSFYVPSWNDDFTLTQTVSPAAVTMFVKDIQYFNLVGTDPARAHLMIRLKDGSRFFRPINSIGRTGNELSINFVTALGVEMNTTNCKQISVVMLYRFESDRTTFQWLTNGVAVVDAMLKSVKA